MAAEAASQFGRKHSFKTAVSFFLIWRSISCTSRTMAEFLLVLSIAVTDIC